MQIQKIVSKKGIEAWLVEDHSRPILSLQFGFAGGTVQDPEGKPGVATFVAGMLDEGAGDLDSEAFQNRLEDLAAKMTINASYDHVTGSFQTLSQNRDEAIKLLRMALTSPHFGEKDVERIREQLLATLRVEEKDPTRSHRTNGTNLPSARIPTRARQTARLRAYRPSRLAICATTQSASLHATISKSPLSVTLMRRSLATCSILFSAIFLPSQT